MLPSYWVTWFPGALLAFLGVLTLGFKGIVWFVNATRTLKQTQEALPVIQAEFSRNGGQSMRDRVEALHTKQFEFGRTMTEHITQDRRAFSRQERTNGRVEATLERIEKGLKP
jgi:hypothetical protein